MTASLFSPLPAPHYLDAAAMPPMPLAVSKFLIQRLGEARTNVHRSTYAAGEATDAAYQRARTSLASLLGITANDISFTNRTTDALNGLAQSIYAAYMKKPNLRIWVTSLEHHANYLPWQRLAQWLGATFLEVPLTPGTLLPDLHWMRQEVKAGRPPLLLACTHVSNVTGGVVDLNLVREAIGRHPFLVVDGAQALPHLPVDLNELPVDAYAASGYKFGAPTGIGFLYLGERLRDLPPPILGGGMVSHVHAQHSQFLPFPEGWEAGTPHVDGALSMPVALTAWRSLLNTNEELVLKNELLSLLATIPAVTVLDPIVHPTPNRSVGIVSFSMKGWHPHDLGTLLGERGIAVRVGHHCAQPLMKFCRVSSVVRVSFGPYNTTDDVMALILALKELAT
jgi:cysteine desulfurase / selenocysteine lyase